MLVRYNENSSRKKEKKNKTTLCTFNESYAFCYKLYIQYPFNVSPIAAVCQDYCDEQGKGMEERKEERREKIEQNGKRVE